MAIDMNDWQPRRGLLFWWQERSSYILLTMLQARQLADGVRLWSPADRSSRSDRYITAHEHKFKAKTTLSSLSPLSWATCVPMISGISKRIPDYLWFPQSFMPEQLKDPQVTSSITESTKKRSDLEDFERSDSRPPFILTYPEVKLLGIAGVSTLLVWFYHLTCFKVGFFLDGENCARTCTCTCYLIRP